MSKYSELLIKICNFMIHLLNDILPGEEPTDTVKYAIQKVVFAIIKFSKLMKCNIFPLGFETEDLFPSNFILNPQFNDLAINNIEEEDLQSQTFKKKSNKTQPNLDSTCVGNVGLIQTNEKKNNKKTVSYTNKSKECQIDSHKANKPIISESGYSHVSKVLKAEKQKVGESSLALDCFDSNYTEVLQIAKENNKKSETISKINKCQGNSHNCAQETSITPKSCNINSIQLEANLNDSRKSDDWFENNFLKFYFFTDTNKHAEEGHALKSDKKNNFAVDLRPYGYIFNEVDMSEDPDNCAQHLKMCENKDQAYSNEFIALNICVRKQILSQAYYCMKCNISLDSLEELEHHRIDEEKEGNKQWVIISLCQKCILNALVPILMVEQVKEFHNSFHIQSNFSLINYGEDINNFSNKLLEEKYRFEKEMKTVSFLGICLICKEYYKNPIEWGSHIYEVGHLIRPEECFITCVPCCLVFLGVVQDNPRILNLQHHLINCPRNRMNALLH